MNRKFLTYLFQFFLEIEMFQTKVVEKITCFIFNKYFILKSCLFKITWKNFVNTDRTEMTIWRMRIAYWITKATHTFTLWNTYCFSTAKLVARMGLHITFYLHCLLCFISLRRTDRSSREVPWNVVSEAVVKQQQGTDPGSPGPLAS